MRRIFVIREENDSEILDPHNNIDRFRRMRCLNIRRLGIESIKTKKKVLSLGCDNSSFKCR